MKDMCPPPGLAPPAEENVCGALGGLFPLPELHVECAATKLSRGSSQRRNRRIRLQVDTNEAVRALNWMAGAPQDRGAFSPSRLQQEALEHVKAACVASLELPEGATSPCSPEAAFRELLRGSSVYEAAGSTLASFSLDRVSLPESVHDCPQVTDLLYGTDAHQYLEDPERMLKPAEDHSDITPYWDPLLRKSVRHYKSLIQRLHKIGYCSYTLTPKERAGIFVVKKSDGVRQRLIIDGRRANFRFATPPSVRLCSPESFAKAEITWEDFDHTLFPGFEALPELHVGLSDIRDCFHRLKQPRWLQEFFCFDPVPAKWVGLSGQELGGTQLKPDDLVYPMPSSLPMGCSWSLYFAQTISEKLMGEVKGLEQSSLLRDRGPPLVIKVPRELLEGRSDPGPGAGKPRPEGDPRHYVYVDNLGVLSMDRSVVESSLSSITETFEQRGLKLHPGEVKSHKVDALGCRLSGRQCRASLKPARMWRLRQGIRHMLKMRCVSGRVLEVLIGHATYCSLLNRCLMPIFHATYKFIRKHYGERVTLWATVRREFEVFAALLPLCFSDWSRAWNGYISASDASLTGFGVCGRRIDPEIAAQVGRVPERERFRRCPSTSARASALSAALTENESDMDQEVEALLEAGWEVDASFVEVPRALLRKSDWEVNLYGKWAYPDDILVLEGHALVKSLSRIAHTRHGKDARQLLLVDNLPVALAFDRGRSRNYKVLRCIRKFSALCLSRNLACAVRWIPSELNSADKPSRVFEVDGSEGASAAAAVSKTWQHSTQVCESPRCPKVPGESLQGRLQPCQIGYPEHPGRPAVRDGTSADSSQDRGRADRDRKASGARQRRKLLQQLRGHSRSNSGCQAKANSGGAKEKADPEISRLCARQRSQGDHLPRRPGRDKECAEDLRCGGGPLPVLPQQARTGLEHRSGRGHRRVPEPPLLAGRAALQGGKVPRRVDAPPPALWQGGGPEACQELESSERMETTLPGQLQETHAAWGLVRRGGGVGEKGATQDGAFRDGFPVYVRPSIGVAPLPDTEFGPSVNGGHGRVGHSFGAARATAPYQDGRLRPLRSPRLQVPQTVERPPLQGLENAAPGIQPLGLWLRGVPERLSSSQLLLAARPQSVSDPSQRTEHRQSQELAASVRGPEARELASSQIRAEVRERSPPRSELPEPHASSARTLRPLRNTGRGSAPGPQTAAAKAVRRRCPGQYFLDLFAGKGGVSSSLRSLGFRSFEFELERGTQYDLTDKQVLKRLNRAFCRKEVLGAMLATPCTTFSVARDRTEVLRSREHPWGLPPQLLSEADRKKVSDGNACAQATLKIIAWCDRLQLPWIVANPISSKLWQLPEFQRLLHADHTEVAVIDFCAYGRRWRKRTQLLTGNVSSQDVARLQGRRCGGSRGVCSFSGHQHFRLTGLGPEGTPWNKIAQPYPPALCRDLAFLLSASTMFAGQHPISSSWMIWG